jgi:hypothetical protein
MSVETTLQFLLCSSSFPADWKISKNVPIPKKSDPTELGDYRQISILPALSKAIEIFMRGQMVVFVDNFSLLDCLESGFRPTHCTTTAMLKVTNDIQFSCDRKLMTVLLLFDFSKAFDNVVHSLLCSKLFSPFRFHGTAVKLTRSYLSDRYQLVCVDGKISELVLVVRGVVQGSISWGHFCSPYFSKILHRELEIWSFRVTEIFLHLI